MASRLGVDVGGTFTDLIFYDDESQEIRVAKRPTTPQAPDQAVEQAVAEVVPTQLLHSARYFLHGTTVGLNSLLERRGRPVGLLATRGFRDVLEIRRGDRDDPYDLFWRPPPPLVPRHLRLPVTERIMADGSVLVPLEEEDVRRAAAVFAAEDVGSVAIAFLHAYANPAHELAAERVLRDCGFTGDVSLSHRVSGEYREYERTCTTVIDAWIKPRVAGYLRRLEEKLRRAGFGGEALVTRCGGGALPFAEAASRPFETILSGPVAGAEGAAELARDLGLGDVITADVGGTSFDTCLITGGRPQVMYEGRVVGLPLQTPWVDVRSIGAGGGSVIHVDVGGLLRVGPRSAGADPGPACYGRGGTEPTLTDAALLLGMFGEGQLASGLRLDPDLAVAALHPLCGQVGLDLEGVARGALLIASANMANAIREITVEQGQDPRRARLVAFGGAGPLFATLLARELEIGEIVIPPYAGNFSAWGLLGADVTRTASQTQILKLTDGSVERANATLDRLFAGLPAGGGAGRPSRREAALDMRYVGQEHTITVAVRTTAAGLIAEDIDSLRRAFTQEYARTFGHTMEEEVEVVSIRATVRTPLPRRAESRTRAAAGDGRRPAIQETEAYSFSRERRLRFRLLERASLNPGTLLEGPAIILEETATTYLDAGFRATVHPSGCLFITAGEGSR
jgi:N-methylhydantoinase A